MPLNSSPIREQVNSSVVFQGKASPMTRYESHEILQHNDDEFTDNYPE